MPGQALRQVLQNHQDGREGAATPAEGRGSLEQVAPLGPGNVGSLDHVPAGAARISADSESVRDSTGFDL